jgi:hypothetical protein
MLEPVTTISPKVNKEDNDCVAAPVGAGTAVTVTETALLELSQPPEVWDS